MSGELKPKKWVVNAFQTVMNALLTVMGAGAYGIASQGVKTGSELIQAIKEPEKNTDPRKFIDSVMMEFLTKLQQGEFKEPFTPILFLLVYIGIALRYPLIASSILTEKYFTQNVREKIRPSLLDIQSLIAYYYRNPQESEHILKELAKQGLEDKDINILIELYKYIPTASDIIRFGVREVYNEDIVAQYQMDKGFDELKASAEEDMRKAGLPEETLRKYWRAHWQLPSIQMGYEMLHRGIITEEELKTLAKTLDIMPGWVDKLIKISYSPYTRVDIRRMHKLGVLSDEDLVKAYMDIGYDREHAEKLALFTIEYNREPAENEKTASDVEAERMKELSKTDILKGYREGLLKKEDAKKYLTGLGYPDVFVDYYLGREDYQKELDIKDATLNLYKKGYIMGIFPKEKVIELFGKLNFPDKYQEHLFTLWDLEKSVKFDIPSKTEILRWYKKGYIDENKTKTLLKYHGYTDEFIEIYVKEVKESMEEV